MDRKVLGYEQSACNAASTPVRRFASLLVYFRYCHASFLIATAIMPFNLNSQQTRILLDKLRAEGNSRDAQFIFILTAGKLIEHFSLSD